MKKSLRIEKILYFLLILLPIIDNIYKYREDTNSPAVMIRAGVTVLMFVMLIPLVIKYRANNNKISWHVILLLLYMAIVSILIDNGFSSAYSYTKICYPLMGFLLVYYLTKYSLLDEKFFTAFIFLLIVVYGCISFLNIGYRMEGRGLSHADNTGYSLVMLLGGVLLFSKKKTLFTLSIFIIVVGAVISGKRGALVALLFAIIPLIKYILTSYSKNSIRKISIIFVTIVASILVFYWFGDFFEASRTRFQSLGEDGGSGRNMMYHLYWNQFLNSDLFHQIFGHGLFAGQISNGRRYAFIELLAHNDWLEMLYDFGVIGCILFVFVFVDIFRLIRKNRKIKDDEYYMLIIMGIIFGIKSILSSTFLMSPNTIYMFTLLAYATAKLEVRQFNLSKS